ncbi:MAG: MFS transporter [Halioglobus sp.]
MTDHQFKSKHFLLLNLGHALNHYLILVFPTVALFLVDVWGMSYSDLLKLGSVGVLAYGAGALPAGWLADRYGRSKLMTVFFVGIGASSVLAGQADTPVQLMVAVSLLGLFASIYHPVGIAMVYEASSRPGRLLAINGVAGNLGLAAAAGMTTVLAQHWGWGSAFVVPGIVSIVLGITYMRIHKNAETVYSAPTSTTNLQRSVNNMPRIFFCIAIVAVCGGLVFNSLTTALPKILAEQNGGQLLSLTAVGGIATAILVFASCAQLIVGELLDRYTPEVLLTAMVSLQILALLAAILFASPIIPLAAALFLTFGQIPINDLMIGKNSSNEWRSRFYAMKYSLGLGVASIAYWLIAVTHDIGNGFGPMYSVLVLSMTFALLAAFALIALNRDPEKSTA